MVHLYQTGSYFGLLYFLLSADQQGLPNITRDGTEGGMELHVVDAIFFGGGGETIHE